ncbi:MAG: hypothetical protein IPF54_27800 [Draconibacterium sp.]|nr:hypothetical protein [Draconibacterium sp.]
MDVKKFNEYFSVYSKQQLLSIDNFRCINGIFRGNCFVYLRELYYPYGFQFPLKEMSPAIIIIEWTREICTLLMLGSVAWISGKILIKRFSVFFSYLVFGI